MNAADKNNIDIKTVHSFGSEWSHFNQIDLESEELHQIFQYYFSIFPWEALPKDAEGFDMGCGSGRWAKLVAPKVGRLNCIDPSDEALGVARHALAGIPNVHFFHASANTAPIQPGSQDFGYSLGVLHHVPDTAAAMKACTDLLKPGAPFLVYLYYRFDNRPLWFQLLWQTSEAIRGVVSRLPTLAKPIVTDIVAALAYWPLARLAWLVERVGVNPSFLPLSFYRDKSFYTMRTDSRDRFGTPLEQRFTKIEITRMMEASGLVEIEFSEHEPYWVAVGVKRR